MSYLFIVCSRSDQAAADQIIERLRRMYFEVWFEPDERLGHTKRSRVIQNAIDEADKILLVLSPNASAAPNVEAEIEYAKTQRKPIVSLQIAPTTPSDWRQLGIETLPIIDFAADPEAGFRALLDYNILPPPLDRDRRRLDHAYNQLHNAYLQSLATRCSPINLTYLLDAAPTRRVTVMDIYVLLNIDLALNVRKGSPVDDWWLSTNADSGKLLQGTLPKSLDNFTPRGRSLDVLIDIIKRNKAASRVYAEVLDAETAVALMPYLVITGDPGSGKSTLMRYILLCLAGDMLPDYEARLASLSRLHFWPLPAYTPIYVEMRELISATFPGVDEEITLAGFLEYLRRHQLAPYGVEAYLAALRDQMDDGAVMFFLDGLDEVPQADEAARREQIKAFVQLLKAHFPRCRIVVTSRPYAYAGDWKLDGFGQVHLSILDPDRLQELARRLFRVTLDPDTAVPEADLFKTYMMNVPAALRNNPLFFTLMAAIWLNNRAKMPGERLPVLKGAIYRECVEMLIRRWTRQDPDKHVSLADAMRVNESQLRDILETLAFHVHQKWHQDDDAVFEAGQILEVLQALKLENINNDVLLETLSQRAGIIYEKAPGRFQFAHRSLQEYLAACYLSGPANYPVATVQTIASAPQHWHNVMDLLPDEIRRRQEDLSALVQELLAVDTFSADRTDQSWCVYYAWHLLQNYLPADRPPFLAAVTAWFVNILQWGVLPVLARADVGDVLGELGDPREGVGVKAGIPDIDWCDVPGGVFVMGSGDPSDNPRREVDLPAFKISRYPITAMQYQTFLDAPDGYQNPAWWNGLHEEGRQQRLKRLSQCIEVIPNHPIENVSWYEAVAFCAWLSARVGTVIRLPTEAEWEKAARGTDERTYPWGNRYTADCGNVDERWGTAYNQKRTTAVGLYPQGASPYGVLDMSGNVWEWTLTDFWQPARTDLGTDAPRAVRGGSWNNYESFARTTYRHTRPPNFCAPDVGFRVAIGASPISVYLAVPS